MLRKRRVKKRPNKIWRRKKYSSTNFQNALKRIIWRSGVIAKGVKSLVFLGQNGRIPLLNV
jgi:hypothetical protein